MKNNYLTIALIIILLVVLIPLVLLFTRRTSQPLTAPSIPTLTQPTLSPTPTPSPTPQEFHFDSTTNLKEELQSIDPKIEDPNIDKLKGIIQSL